MTNQVRDAFTIRSIAGHAPDGTPVLARSWLRAALGVAAIGWGAQEFTPLLLLYQSRLHLSSATVQATFVPYVIGLAPGLLLGGPVSDRFGRRWVVAPTILVSALATLLMLPAGGHGVGWLFLGRFTAGVASGAGFSSGAAWIKELSTAASPDGGNHGPRRLTIAMGVGFGLGPAVSGILAQWAPWPTVLPYLPHLVLTAVAFAAVLGTPETLVPNASVGMLRHLRLHEVRSRRFLTVVLPLAPWVFIPVSVAVAYLPGLVKTHVSGYPLLFSAAVTVTNAAAGILVQPVARRINHPTRPTLLASAMSLIVVGMVLAVLALRLQWAAGIIVVSFILGAGYGGCQVYGLLEAQRLARPEHTAGLTATYQALSYVGFAASYPLAALQQVFAATTLLSAVAVLALLTLLFTTRCASSATTPVRGQAEEDVPPMAVK